MSLRAARMVAANRMANFLSAVTWTDARWRTIVNSFSAKKS